MTNARIQRLLMLGSFGFWWVVALWLWHAHRALAIFCLGMPLLITPGLIALQCAISAWINRAAAAPRASFADWLAVWLKECQVVALVFLFWQPWRQHAVPDRTQGAPGQRGIILVHGFFCNRALWTAWMKRLHTRERPFMALDLEPAFGSISRYADVIDAAIAHMQRTTGAAPVLVGHSMGGLAIRAWATQYGHDGLGLARVHHIFTLGTPHHGTALAKFAPSHNSHQMQIGSTWLAQNHAALPADFAKKLTCFYSNCDNIVFPASTACFEGANNCMIPACGHVALAFDADVERACMSAGT